MNPSSKPKRLSPVSTQAILDALTEGVLLVDGDSLIRYANQQVETLFGWERDELIGQSIDILAPPDLREVYRENLSDFLRQSEQGTARSTQEFLGRHKDGADFPVEVILSPLNTETGASVICLIMDISERVDAKSRIRAGERQFDLLFRAFPLPTYVWQRREDDFILVDYNDADSEYTYNTIRRFLHRGLRFMYPEGGDVANAIERCYREQSRLTHEMPGYRLRTTGEVKDLIFTHVYVEPDLMVTIIEDITAENAALNELKQLSNAVEQTADAVFITDRDGVIEYINPGFEVITGFTRDEALGNNPRILKSGQMPPEYYQRLWETVLSGSPFQAQTVNHRRDGTQFVAEQTITPMKDHEGQITHFVSVLKDVTERIRLQEQETELRLAGMIQHHRFPAHPPQLAGYDIAGAVFPAQMTSGDYYDYITLPGDNLGIVVADVCDHGMGAALIMAETRAYLRTIARFERRPHSILRELNRLIEPDLAHDSNFITMFLALLDPEQHLLECANAGNWPAYILSPQGKVLHELRTDGIPIGLFPDLMLRHIEPINLDLGSIAVFLTDGIPDARNNAGEHFDAQRMLDVIVRHRAAPAQEIINQVRGAVQQFARTTEQADDQTLVICKRVS